MYFGIYGERWLRERKDVMRLYLNEYWSRPKENEKPMSAKDIENNCYW
jgi:regulator of sigma D